jgi:hypothetical protein
MGTKNNPGKYDCYAKAEPDEPMFILLARDTVAPKAVIYWCEETIKLNNYLPGLRDLKIDEAFNCASAMRNWRAQREETERRKYFISVLSDEELVAEVKRRSMPR